MGDKFAAIQMKHTKNWAQDWHIAAGDFLLSKKIIPTFEAYLSALMNKGVSKTTFIRHKSACHSLGGYIIEQIYGGESDELNDDETGKDIILRYIDRTEGPLIHQANESWQKEIDATCKKLYRFIATNAV